MDINDPSVLPAILSEVQRIDDKVFQLAIANVQNQVLKGQLAAMQELQEEVADQAEQPTASPPMDAGDAA